VGDTVAVGFGITVNDGVLIARPPGVVTLIGPVVAPAGTVAVSCVAELAVNVAAATPLNVTDVAPVKLLPCTVTTVPGEPVVGTNFLIAGAAADAAAAVAHKAPHAKASTTTIRPMFRIPSPPATPMPQRCTYRATLS
jgi:hypothetical protein